MPSDSPSAKSLNIVGANDVALVMDFTGVQFMPVLSMPNPKSGILVLTPDEIEDKGLLRQKIQQTIEQFRSGQKNPFWDLTDREQSLLRDMFVAQFQGALDNEQELDEIQKTAKEVFHKTIIFVKSKKTDASEIELPIVRAETVRNIYEALEKNRAFFPEAAEKILADRDITLIVYPNYEGLSHKEARTDEDGDLVIRDRDNSLSITPAMVNIEVPSSNIDHPMAFSIRAFLKTRYCRMSG